MPRGGFGALLGAGWLPAEGQRDVERRGCRPPGVGFPIPMPRGGLEVRPEMPRIGEETGLIANISIERCTCNTDCRTGAKHDRPNKEFRPQSVHSIALRGRTGQANF
mmetsp:Transcript_62841/g.205158  ORF Transcript_62841/g.205158 Transcript_62841/m.205158 type:complete len:107 (+) Transcript_62841:146-466(+)